MNKTTVIRFHCPVDLAKEFDFVLQANNSSRSETLRECVRSIVKDHRRFEATYGKAIPSPVETQYDGK